MAKSFLGSFVSSATKAVDRAIKQAAQERARQARANARAADADLKRSTKEREKQARELFISEQSQKGYDYVLISSLHKYRQVMGIDDLATINEALSKGVKRVFIGRERLADYKASLNRNKKPIKKPKNGGINNMSSH